MPGLNLTQMRRGIRKATGVEDEDDPDLTNDEIDLYLNRALWEVDNKFPFKEKEKTVTFRAVVGIRNYDVPKPFDAVKSLAIFDRYSGQSQTLRYMETFEYENLYIDDGTTNNYGKPIGYTRENCFVRLYPTPNYEYLISLKRLITIEDLSATHDSPDIPQVWHEVLQFGGLWRALIDFGDIGRANQIKNHQISIINSIVPTESKEEGRDKYAGLEVLRRGYDDEQWWTRT
jgi:hypothetical protein